MNKTIFTITISILCGLFFETCIEEKDNWSNEPITENIGTLLKKKDSVSIFYKYVFDSTQKIFNLDSLIRTTNISKEGYTGPGFIVFAPTNSAFNRLANQLGITNLSQIKKNILKDIIKHHIVKGTTQRQYLKETFLSSIQQETMSFDNNGIINTYQLFSKTPDSLGIRYYEGETRGIDGIIQPVQNVLLPKDLYDIVKKVQNTPAEILLWREAKNNSTYSFGSMNDIFLLADNTYTTDPLLDYLTNKKNPYKLFLVSDVNILLESYMRSFNTTLARSFMLNHISENTSEINRVFKSIQPVDSAFIKMVSGKYIFIKKINPPVHKPVLLFSKNYNGILDTILFIRYKQGLDSVPILKTPIW